MKVFVPIFAALAMVLVSCGDSDNKRLPETKKTTDSVVSKDTAGVTEAVNNEIDSLRPRSVKGQTAYLIDNMLDNYETMIDEIRKEYFIDEQYITPPGHQYHIHIHPVIVLYEDLHSRQSVMTPVQLSRFKKLTKRILATF